MEKDIRGIIFIIENNFSRFLLQQRDENSKYDPWSWVFPGGKIEENETSFDAFLREIGEEFNFIVKRNECKKIGAATTHTGRGYNELWYCQIVISPPIIINEGVGAGWFTFDEIQKIQLGYKQNDLVLPILTNYLEQAV